MQHGMAHDPLNADLIYRQDHRGVYKTLDGGDHWALIEKADAQSVENEQWTQSGYRHEEVIHVHLVEHIENGGEDQWEDKGVDLGTVAQAKGGLLDQRKPRQRKGDEEYQRSVRRKHVAEGRNQNRPTHMKCDDTFAWQWLGAGVVSNETKHEFAPVTVGLGDDDVFE